MAQIVSDISALFSPFQPFLPSLIRCSSLLVSACLIQDPLLTHSSHHVQSRVGVPTVSYIICTIPIKTSRSVMFCMLYCMCQIYSIVTDQHNSSTTSVGLTHARPVIITSTGTLFLSCHIQEYFSALDHVIAEATAVARSAGPVPLPLPLSCLLLFACITLAWKMVFFFTLHLHRLCLQFTIFLPDQ